MYLNKEMISMTIPLILHECSNHTPLNKLKYSLQVCGMTV